MTSTDGGQTWSKPTVVDDAKGDQWFPWADVNPVTGQVGILYNDRGSSNGKLHGATLAEATGGGSFTKTLLSTAPSDPVDSVFFQAGVPDCELCAVFHGDYISLAYGPDGHANAVWTDMRDFSPGDGAFQQFIYFARH
jgi:hypothetical protein